MRKLLSRTTADSATAPVVRSTEATPVTGRLRKSQDAVHDTGLPISCFDASPDRCAFILGGPHILRTVKFDETETENPIFVAGVDIRSSITSRQICHGALITADQLNIRDVKWHGSSTIFTACASGKIFAYDIARLGEGATESLDLIQIHEDSRQVTSLDINPHWNNWILSGSQDGTVRVFDASTTSRNRFGALTFRQRFAPLRCNDSVKQVKWSPNAGHELACCTDAGVVLKWDVRQPSRPMLRINAHEKACSAIAWHPDGLHLLSAGGDARLQIWDLGASADKRQKPKWTIATPIPVTAVAWRPECRTMTHRTKRVAQIAVAYDEPSSRHYGTSLVHIWDFARPTMPYKQIERFDSSPAALFWHDWDKLWTVGHDGFLNRCDPAFGSNVMDRQSTSAVAFSPRGKILMFLDERPRRQMPRSFVHEKTKKFCGEPIIQEPGASTLSASCSESDEDGLNSFLNTRSPVFWSNERSGTRSSASLSRLSAPTQALPRQQLSLDNSILQRGSYISRQALAVGALPAAKLVSEYQYLTRSYLETLQAHIPMADGRSLDIRVGEILKRFAKTAELNNSFRLAQTWKILAFAISLLLRRRAEFHLYLRIGYLKPDEVRNHKWSRDLRSFRIEAIDYAQNAESTPSQPSVAHSNNCKQQQKYRPLLTDDYELTSKIPSPLVGAACESNTGGPEHNKYGERPDTMAGSELQRVRSVVPDSFQKILHPRLISDVTLRAATGLKNDLPSLTEISGKDERLPSDLRTEAVHASASESTPGWYQQGCVPSQLPHGSEQRIGQILPMSNRLNKNILQSASSCDAFNKVPSPGQGLPQPCHSEEPLDQFSTAWCSKAAIDIEQAEAKAAGGIGDDIALDLRKNKSLPAQSIVPFDDPSAPKLELANAISQTALGGRGASVSSTGTEIPKRHSSSETSPTHARSEVIEENDFLPWLDDPQYPYTYPTKGEDPSETNISSLDPYALLTRALDFESRTSSLNASAIVLLMKPLVPSSVIDNHRASTVLRQQHTRLMRMSLFTEAALLRNLCVKGWPTGLSDWGDNFTAIFSPAQRGGKIGLACAKCRTPREVKPAAVPAVGITLWICTQCGTAMPPCVVCGHREPQRPSSVPSEIIEGEQFITDTWLEQWFFCPGCTHGGHASCLQIWHGILYFNSSPPNTLETAATYSNGCCPSEGCGHICLQNSLSVYGKMSNGIDELSRASTDDSALLGHSSLHQRRHGVRLSAETAEAASRGSFSPPSFTSDHATFPMNTDKYLSSSRAIGLGRETVTGRAAGGILSSSPIRMSGDRERRKSVKFARTERD